MDRNRYELLSPLMGTFYRSSAPGRAPLVDIGQTVQADDVVCAVESMKIFTELRTAFSGVVKEILVENEEMVMKGQAIMIIEKQAS